MIPICDSAPAASFRFGRGGWLTTLAAALLILFAAVPASAAGLTFLPYDQALKQAETEKKLVMVFFWADWCRYCTQLKTEVFESEKVRTAFDKSFLAVSVDIENDPEKISAKYKPQALPTLAFIRPNGEMLGVLPGYTDADTFIEVLDYVGTEAKK